MAIAKSSFLESLNADLKKQRSREARREELLRGRKKGDDVLKHFHDLQVLADELDNKVEKKLNDNETAFFLAYKKHMFTVQKEFRELRQKADEEETKTRRDEKIRSLETELDWFMNEALRLDELCKKNKKELDKWKGKAESLEDDRQFLENQIKSAKRSNKSLRSSVEKAQTSAYSALVAAEAGGSGNALGATAPAALQDGGAPALGDVTSSSALAIEDASAAEPERAGSGLARELEERYASCVKRLRSQLETEQRYAAKLRGVSDRQFSEPSELESVFLQCVDVMRGHIGERRREQGQQAQKLQAGRAKATKGGARATSVPPVSPPDPATGVSLEDFTPADRRQVVELLLSSEQVLQFLYDKLFPPALENGSHGHGY